MVSSRPPGREVRRFSFLLLFTVVVGGCFSMCGGPSCELGLGFGDGGSSGCGPREADAGSKKDAATCQPALLPASWTPEFDPAFSSLGSCSSEDVETFLTLCLSRVARGSGGDSGSSLDGGADGDAGSAPDVGSGDPADADVDTGVDSGAGFDCDGWLAAHAACAGCLVSSPPDRQLIPKVIVALAPNEWVFNRGACLEHQPDLADADVSACAAELSIPWACPIDSCAKGCPKTSIYGATTEKEAERKKFEGCLAEARALGICAQFTAKSECGELFDSISVDAGESGAGNVAAFERCAIDDESLEALRNAVRITAQALCGQATDDGGVDGGADATADASDLDANDSSD